MYTWLSQNIGTRKFQDFAAKSIIRQATLNSRPFLVPHSNRLLNSTRTLFLVLFFVHITTDWNHLSDDQVKAPTLEDFRRWITAQSTIETTKLIREGEKGGRGYGGGGRGRLYTYRYNVTTRMTSALRWAAMRAILMFHNCEGQSHKTVSTDYNF